MSELDTADLYFPNEPLNTGPVSPVPGFPFSNDSPIRRFGEPVSAVMVPYIAGLTVMDDHIAAAVEAHSHFTTHPWGRLISTARATVSLVFGNEEESLGTAERLWRYHEHTVQGTHDGISYDANNGPAQTWVLAAVFNGVEIANERWGKHLSPDDRAALWHDVFTFGRVFGVPEQSMPQDISEFDDYWNDTVHGKSLLQTDVSQCMARTVFRFEHPKVPKALSVVGQALWVTSLDPALQERARLWPTIRDERIARAADIVLRANRVLPESLREGIVPAAVSARRQLTPVTNLVHRLRHNLEISKVA